MRKGNSSYDRSNASYSPDKSYELASWQDYVDWLIRCGFEAEYTRHEGLRIYLPTGGVAIFTTKLDVYKWLLDEDDYTSEDVYDVGVIDHNVDVEEIANE